MRVQLPNDEDLVTMSCFCPSTGRQYMRVANDVDERRDPIRATAGAVRHLSGDHDALGSWPLAITAYDQDLAVGPNFPQGYGRHALGPVRPEPPAAAGWLYAAGELAMSARDLAKWDIARINRTLLKPADWAVQETSIKLKNGNDTRYGLGVSIRDLGGRRNRFVAGFEFNRNTFSRPRNIGNIATVAVRDLNPVSVLGNTYLVIENPEAAVKIVEGRLAKKK